MAGAHGFFVSVCFHAPVYDQYAIVNQWSAARSRACYAARSAAAGSTKTPHVGVRAAAAQHAQPRPWHQSSAPATGALNLAARAAGSGVSLGSARSKSSSAPDGSASSAAAVVIA